MRLIFLLLLITVTDKDRAFKNLMCEVYDVFMNKQKEIYKEGTKE